MGRIAQWLLIRRGEGRIVAYLGTLYLIIGLGMGIGHSSSDALFFKRVGVAYLPHMLLFVSIALFVFSAVYAGFVDRVRSWRLFQIVFVVVALYLLGAWMLMRHVHGPLGFALYFLGYSVISEIVIMHFNLYACSFLDTSQSKRLSPLLNASARLGVIGGGIALGLTANSWPTEHMALAWGALTLVALSLIGFRHGRDPAPKIESRKRPYKVFTEINEGLRFARRSSLLKLTGVGVFIMIILVSVQDYLVSTILTAHYPDERSLAAFFGWFAAISNALVLLLQLTVSNRLLQRFGLKTFNLIFPWSTIFSFALLSLSASFIPALIARFNYRGMIHAFRNPAANAFYNALPAYMQGRARAMTVGLILPLGLGAAGLFILLIPKSLSAEPLAMVGLTVALLYLYFKVQKNKVYGETLIELIQSQVHSTKRIDLTEFGHLDNDVVEKITALLKEATDDDDVVESYVEILLTGAPEKGALIVLQELPHLSFPLQDRLLRKLALLRSRGWEEYAITTLDSEDVHLRATALTLLLEHSNQRAEQYAKDWLAGTDSRLQSAAAAALLAHTSLLNQQARQVLLEMLSSIDTACVLSALGSLNYSTDGNFIVKARTLTQHADPRVRASSLPCLARLCASAGSNCAEELTRALTDPIAEVRVAAVYAATFGNDTDKRLAILHSALEDIEFSVRGAALSHAQACMPRTIEEYRTALHRYMDVFPMQSLLCKSLGDSNLNDKVDILLEIGQKHLDLAYQKQSLRICLQNLTSHSSGKDMAESFLATVLQEEIQRHINLILKILESRDESQSVHAIRAALASGDRRLRAQGLESLRHTRNNVLLETLLPLLEAEYDAAEWRHDPPHKFTTVEEVRKWCAHEGSNWLKQCAIALEPALKGA